MAEAAPEKSRGLKFAEQQLLRHGWEQGKGLGRDENGISEAIKVKVKCDKGGIGHKESEQFTFHWWDHVFNKASSGLAVETDQNGVVVKKTNEEAEEGMISNKKPRIANLNKSALYGSFIKSATLLSGEEHSELKSSSSDSSSSEDEEKLDLSSTTKLSDAQLIKACGGRTAHKGARHGLTMSAKLARLEQQEQEFMAKYAKTKQVAQTTPQSQGMLRHTETRLATEHDISGRSNNKKEKKRKKDPDELREDDTNTKTHRAEETAEKQKKHEVGVNSDKPAAALDSSETIPTKRKKKRKRFEELSEASEELDRSSRMVLDEDTTQSLLQREEEASNETNENTSHQHTSDGVHKKEKRKKKKHYEKLSALKEGLNVNGAMVGEVSADTTECYVKEQKKEGDIPVQCVKKAKKKKKEILQT